MDIAELKRFAASIGHDWVFETSHSALRASQQSDWVNDANAEFNLAQDCEAFVAIVNALPELFRMIEEKS